MNFNISVDGDLDTQYIKLPTMILQPFVENAINHGLFHKVEEGNLDIKFNKNGENIEIIIFDDGIGRVKAQEIRRKSLKNYKSTALKIIEERLDILKNTQHYNININIKDLYDENGIGIGTEVNILIPNNS